MREYSKVSPKFWIGSTGRKLRAAGPECLVVSMYLMTSPHANMLGLYYCPISYIAHETGLGFEGASKGLRSAIEAGFCRYDHESDVVWVVEMARYQVGDTMKLSDLRVKGVQSEYDNMLENAYLSEFYDRYAEAFCMTSKRCSRAALASPLQAPCKPLRSQEQEHATEQAKEKEHWERDNSRLEATCASAPVSADAPTNDNQPAEPSPDETAKRAAAKAGRLSVITREAVAAYNAELSREGGGALSVVTLPDSDVRRNNVRRCLKTAKMIADALEVPIDADFWANYFAECAKDDFHAGRGPYTGTHANWRPDFEYLTRPDVMTKIFDKARG